MPVKVCSTSGLPRLRWVASTSSADGDACVQPLCRRVPACGVGLPHPGRRVAPGAASPAGRSSAIVRIAQIAPLYEAVPPRLYGGTERVIAALCDGLVDRGHDVTLFAADSSSPTAADARVGRVTASRDAHEPARAGRGRPRTCTCGCSPTCTSGPDEFDVIHSHIDVWTLPFTHRTATPSVLTLHGRLDTDHVQRGPAAVPRRAARLDQRRPARAAATDRTVDWAGTVLQRPGPRRLRASATCHAATTSPSSGASARRSAPISPSKSPAAPVARCASRPRSTRSTSTTSSTTIEPLLGADDVDFVGETRRSARSPPSSPSAAATLFPSDWPEPFGLVMIESMAAGTPVIALRRGAVPEVLDRRRHRVHLRRRRRDGRRGRPARRDRPGACRQRAARSCRSRCAPATRPCTTRLPAIGTEFTGAPSPVAELGSAVWGCCNGAAHRHTQRTSSQFAVDEVSGRHHRPPSSGR